RLVKVVSGGGGAFLALTHELREQVAMREPGDDRYTEYSLAKSWPGVKVSKFKIPWALFKRVFPFSIRAKRVPAWSFALFVGLLYLILAYAMCVAAEASGPHAHIRGVVTYIGGSDWSTGFSRLSTAALQSELPWFIAILFTIG